MNIQHPVATISQPNLNDCWAAATAIAMRRHSNAGTQHVKNLAAAAGVPLDAGTLPDSSVRLLAQAVRLGFHEFPGAREVTLRGAGGAADQGTGRRLRLLQHPEPA